MVTLTIWSIFSESLPEGTEGTEELGTLLSIPLPFEMVMRQKVERDRRPTATES